MSIFFDYLDTQYHVTADDRFLEDLHRNTVETSGEATNEVSITVETKQKGDHPVEKQDFSYHRSVTERNTIHQYIYDQRVRSITIQNNEYYVESHLENDHKAILLPIRDHISRHYTLVHGNMIADNSQGVLLTGETQTGKTDLSLYMARDGCDFIGDELINIHGSQGYYVPHTVFMRFNSVATHMPSVLEEYPLKSTRQYMSNQRLTRILDKEKYDINAGIMLPRQDVIKRLNTTSKPSSDLETVIFLSNTEQPHVRQISSKETKHRLKSQECSRNVGLTNQHPPSTVEPEVSGYAISGSNVHTKYELLKEVL